MTTPDPYPSAPALREAAARAAHRPLDRAVLVGPGDVEALARAIDRIRYARQPRRAGRDSVPYDEAAEVPHIVIRDLTDGLRALEAARVRLVVDETPAEST